MLKIVLGFILLSFFYGIDSVAQVQKRDSLAQDSLSKYTSNLLLNFRSQQIQDSLRRLNLEQHVSQLHNGSDDAEKQKLILELQKLKYKDSIASAKAYEVIQRMKKSAVGFAIAPFSDTLFLVYSPIGSFSTKDRAQAINERIENIASNFTVRLDSIEVISGIHSSDIVLGDRMIMSVSDVDALWNNVNRDTLAYAYKKIIVDAASKYRVSHSAFAIAMKFMWVAVLFLAVIIVVFLTQKLFKVLSFKARNWATKSLKGFKIGTYELLSLQQQIDLMVKFLGWIKIALLILIVYLSLPVLFAIFPESQGISQALIQYTLKPLKSFAFAVYSYIPNFITIVVIFTITQYILKLIHYLAGEIKNEHLVIAGFYKDWADSTFNIIRVLIYAFMFVLIFPYLPGSSSPVFQGVSVFLGILFSVGSAGSISNITAGLVLTYMRSFKVGDYVKVGDVTGTVLSKSMLVTRIQTNKNEEVTIPNSTIMNSHTINYSAFSSDQGLILHTTVTIGYDVPWKSMHEALITAALKTDDVLKEPMPFVLQTSLDDFYVSYQLNAYTRVASHQASVYSELHKHIQDSCNEAGIEIMSPHYRAQRDGNTKTIPNSYLPKDYTAPTFGFSVQDKGKAQ